MGYKSPRFICLNGNHGALAAPADASTYFFGAFYAAPANSAGTWRIYVPIAGFVRVARYDFASLGVVGTNESFNVSLRKNDTTDYLIASVATTDVHRNFANAALAIPVAAGDFLEFKIVTPTWVTNPTDVYGQWEIVFECE